ncbi:Insulin receptor substrate 1-B [Bagarius yarrelli]|uniref:Insulin receptor substrate 1-B n=1 Tax=Bagarius yarrelli TaxID=175774 RepID=A0A556TZA7_BAGYA|nr:Insulin receptor substrate 1-B [Bagarius yarrelli]
METEAPSCEDVRKSGYLRKQKSMHRRYFVLRSASERGPARLEYYESEKKFRSGKATVPKRVVALETCFNINHKHMIVLYTRAESFAVAADSEADQDEWYRALLELHCKSKALCDGNSEDYGMPSPGPAFKEVWQVKVWPKGLGQAKNLVGIYRLCLTEKTVNFVKLNSDAAAVVLQLMNVRRCGHSENFFFVEVGRSAVTGPGEFWMQVEDSVVAQNMHETLLEAMKALSEEFRQRSKSQSSTAGGGGGATASNPISVPSRRHHPNPPPSQVGFIRRPRTEPPGATGGAGGATSTNASPTPRHGFSRACSSSDEAKVEEGMNAGTKGVNNSTSPTANGSFSSTPILRSTSVRASTPVKAQHALMRSISTPAPLPAQNISSYSGTGAEIGSSGPETILAGGNGSTFKRMPLRQPSVSGSLSDYGSSDEYGSSPGEHSLVTTTIQASSVGSSGGDEAANYIIMAQKGTSNLLPHDSSLPQSRRVFRRSSGRECDTERRMISKRASLPPMALERIGTYRRGGDREIEEDNYAVMSRSTSRESFSSRQDSESVGGTRYLDVAEDSKAETGSCGSDGLSIIGDGNVGGDNGYMSMLPGVTAPPVSHSHSLSVVVSDYKPADDYMAMTPNNSVSLPQQIHVPNSTTDGYMMMSPNSSCSPDQRVVSGSWVGRNSADSRPGSDYMNMSPISVRANSTPSPHGSLTASEKHPQQPPPKMVYSYYSLPRSYKHSSTKQDALGRGKCLGSERRNGVSQGFGSCRGTSHFQELGVGRHFSFSSSSYSSSSASSESLGEGEEKLSQIRNTATGAQVKDSGPLPQGLRSGAAKQAYGQRNRPRSLFVDVSKANTLPRVRETPVPPEPKSPGEYVSIEFKSDRNKRDVRGPRQSSSIPASSQNPLPKATSCVAGSLPHPCSPSSAVSPTVASEYVNMELGASPLTSSLPLTPLGFPSFSTPLTPTTLAPKAWDEKTATPQNEEESEVKMVHSLHQQLSGSQSLDSPVPCADYTEMVFGLSSETTDSSMKPKESLLDRQDSMVPQLSLGLNLDFPMPKAPNPDHGAKVIRADPQARRRHCSETFLAPSSLSSCSVSSSSSICLISEHTQAIARRFGLDGILTGSTNLLDIPNHTTNHGVTNINTTQTSSSEQGLNYIDLDLATRESSHHAVDVQTAGQTAARLFSSVLGNGASGAAGGTGVLSSSASNLNTYASIDFYKSEELRSHQGSNSSKDSTARSLDWVLMATSDMR